MRGTRFLAAMAIIAAGFGLAAPAARADDGDIYSTYGAHNPPDKSNCQNPKTCVYRRSKGEPSNPRWPAYWTSSWNMYRVYEGFQQHPPPYDGKPPAGTTYEESRGTTYYDSTIRTPHGRGAMEEHYEKKCLPIFPMENNYSCSFISLGPIAFFVTYDDRPKDMPKVCLFSPLNHPPARDFIKHLPYSLADSMRTNPDGKGKPRLQGYSFWMDPASKPTGKIMQTGVSPDRTADGYIMFGYGFYAQPTPDAVDRKAKPYRHPHSFYFSGFPGFPPGSGAQPQQYFAPIVSQNYTDFAMRKPNRAETWDQVWNLDYKTLPKCQLFNPPGSALTATAGGAAKRPPTWGDLKKD